MIPILPGGTKRPDYRVLPHRLNEETGRGEPEWSTFQERLPTEAEVRRWWKGATPPGIAIVCGTVSGGLELLDFDRNGEEILAAWAELVEAECPGLVDRLSVVRTPRQPAGFHVRYRCTEIAIPGNRKLALDPTAPRNDRVLIETRGEGGYALAPGSPGNCHETGGTYEHESGPKTSQVQTITAAEREVLLRAACSFTREVPPEEPAPPPAARGPGLSPGDDYCARGPDWSEILGPAGWECIRQSGEKRYWRRPGKAEDGWSATTGACKSSSGRDLLCVFSSNAEPFPGPSGSRNCSSHNKFGAFALLNHAGDWKAAARALGQQGYGEQRPERVAASPRHEANGHEAKKQEPCEPEPWEDPVPLTSLPNAPPFPVDILPHWLGDFVTEEARFTQTPPDVAGMLSLGFAGAALAGKFRTLAREGFSEPLNLYVVPVLPPGNRKSAVFSDLVKPVQEHERNLLRSARPRLAAAASDRQVLEGRHKAAVQAASRAEGSEPEREAARSLARELADSPVACPPQVYADDCTAEKVSGLLADQGGRLLVASPEGTIFEIIKGRYADSPNFDVFLKGHSGDPIRVNRVGREPENVDNPALSLALTVQPDVIHGLSDHVSLRGRGLTARVLYAIPSSLLGKRVPKQPPVPRPIVEEYHRQMLRLWETTGCIGDDLRPAAHLLALTTDAQRAFESFEEWIEPRLGEEGDLASMTDWASKLAGASLRIAGILHCATHCAASRGIPLRVEEGFMSAAIYFAREYLIPHAAVAHALLGFDERIGKAKHVLAWIRRTGRTAFTRRDAHRALIRTFAKSEELEPILELLCRNGWIRATTEKGAKTGPWRPPSQAFEAHPKIFLTPVDS